MSIEISDIYIYIYIAIIGIYVRVVRVWCPVFSVYSEAPLEIILKFYSILGILMFAGVRVFKVSTRMCTIKNKMA